MKKNSVIYNFLWRFAERMGAQGVKVVVELIIARLLLPADYGLIALVTVFISILQVFVDSGLGTALIQKLDTDQLDFSSVFWFNIFSSIILYVLLYVLSPTIAAFYNNPEVTAVLRVLGLQLIIAGAKNIQQAYVSRTMQFRKFFFATLWGTIGAAAVGIWMAYRGYGVWALVAQHLFNTLVDTLFLWKFVKWRPSLQFSLNRLKVLFSYGWKLLASALIDTVYREMRQLIIGKNYTSADLSFYNRGEQVPKVFVENINSAIDSVLLPTLSREQDNKVMVKKITQRSIKTSMFIISPMMVGLAAIGEPLIRIILTDKWISAVPFLRIFCFSYMFYPIHTANLNAIKAIGRSDIFLRLEVIKKVLGVIAVVSTMLISVEAMAISMLAMSMINQVVNAYPNKKLLDYSYREQIKDIIPSLLISFIMGICVYLVSLFPIKDRPLIILQILIGAVIYIGGSIVFKNDAYVYVKEMLLSTLFKNK